MKLKDNKGITGADVAVALVILLVFVSFVASLFYNLSSTSKRLERKTTATNLAIQVIEAMKTTKFSTLKDYEANQKEMTESDLKKLTKNDITIPRGYTVKISIKNPKITDENPNGDETMGETIKVITSEVVYSTLKDLDGDNVEDTETVKIETLVKDIQNIQ